MTWPRYVPPGSYCFVTRRCTQRKFLLKPSKAGNRAFEYCIAWAAQATGVQILFSVVLSNHYHLGLYDPEGRVSDFMRELNRHVAKHHNTMYRRRENLLFSSDKFSCVRLESAIDVARRLVYALDNPVKAGLATPPVIGPASSRCPSSSRPPRPSSVRRCFSARTATCPRRSS
jgi:putative transposase